MISSTNIKQFLQSIQEYVEDNNIESTCIHPKALNNQDTNSICWIKKRSLPANLTMICSILITGVDFHEEIPNKTVIKVKNPKYAFVEIVRKYFTEPSQPSISKTATISKETDTGTNIFIDENVIIKGHCIIGNNVIIHPNVTIFGPIKIGNNIEIQTGCVLGAEGFGYAKNHQKEYIKFPHTGGIIVEDNVEIAAYTCIDKGVLNNTIIHKNTKIDKFCHIAHGSRIGENCMIAGGSNIGGSVSIGKDTWLSPKSNILNGISIGENVTVGSGSTVIKNIKSNVTVFGSPAKIIFRKKLVN